MITCLVLELNLLTNNWELTKIQNLGSEGIFPAQVEHCRRGRELLN